MRAPRPKHWIHVGFWAAWVLVVWDLYETILAAGDTPWRIHHGWIGLAGMAIFWIASHWGFYFELLKGAAERLPRRPCSRG